jgi:hypothetical protein
MAHGRVVTLEEVAGLIGHVFGVSPDGTITDYGTSESLPTEMLPFDGGRELLDRPIRGALMFEPDFLINLPIRHLCQNHCIWDDKPQPALPGKMYDPPAVASLTKPKPLPLTKLVLLAATKGIV